MSWRRAIIEPESGHARHSSTICRFKEGRIDCVPLWVRLAHEGCAFGIGVHLLSWWTGPTHPGLLGPAQVLTDGGASADNREPALHRSGSFSQIRKCMPLLKLVPLLLLEPARHRLNPLPVVGNIL
jgi:hypothetical protein